MTTGIANPRMTPESLSSADLVTAFTAAMTSDDVDALKKLLTPDGEWKIMATGETFKGMDKMLELANRSVAARDHGSGEGILPFNVFTDGAGTRLIWEYVHKGTVTEKWPASTHKPVPGTKFELPILLMCEISQGKLAMIREYFDLQTLTEAGTPHHLYS
jgi:ketosteroid isomerase-like protein